MFANLGRSDRLGRDYSIAVEGARATKVGVLHGADAGSNTEVAIVGAFDFKATLLAPRDFSTLQRNHLSDGDVFQVPNSRQANNNRHHKPPMYVALGVVDDDTKVLSLNLNTKKLAIGTNLRGKVCRVGTVKIATNLAA